MLGRRSGRGIFYPRYVKFTLQNWQRRKRGWIIKLTTVRVMPPRSRLKSEVIVVVQGLWCPPSTLLNMLIIVLTRRIMMRTVDDDTLVLNRAGLELFTTVVGHYCPCILWFTDIIGEDQSYGWGLELFTQQSLVIAGHVFSELLPLSEKIRDVNAEMMSPGAVITRQLFQLHTAWAEQPLLPDSRSVKRISPVSSAFCTTVVM